MANPFKNTAPQSVSPRQQLAQNYNLARINLLWVIAFTVVNIVLTVTKSDMYFLFSAYVPYVISTFGMIFAGMYPAEYYEGWEAVPSEAPTVLAVALAIAVVILVFYLLAWIFSKKRVGWLIFALVFFAIDSVLMLLMANLGESIVDILFHAWVIVSLSKGIHAYFKAKALPEEDVAPEQPVAGEGFGWEVPTPAPEAAPAAPAAEEEAAETPTAAE